MRERTPLVAGNWKMHGTVAMAEALVGAIVAEAPDGVEVAVCPPYPYLAGLTRRHAGGRLRFGAQDVSEHQDAGAYTGEVSATMLADVGCTCVLVGHSERRQYHGESDAVVARKYLAACAAGLVPIVCVGETLQQREAGDTEAVIGAQVGAILAAAHDDALRGLVVAYEPVWAIGTGRTASPEQVQSVHAFIRSQLAGRDAKLSRMTRILYGGSVKPGNAGELFAMQDVDGGLIGGAALTAADFLAICRAAQVAAS